MNKPWSLLFAGRGTLVICGQTQQPTTPTTQPTMDLLHDVRGLEMAMFTYYVAETTANASYLQPCNANL